MTDEATARWSSLPSARPLVCRASRARRLVVSKLSLVIGLFGLAVSACADSSSDLEPKLVTAEQAVTTQCPFLDPADPAHYAGTPVDYARELMITDVSVVDDPCRTTHTGSCSGGGTSGVWTFGEMMRRLAGSAPPQVFVADFLHQWEVSQVVNGFTIPARPNFRPLVLDPWLIATGCAAGSDIVGPFHCPLNLERAPLRLLAVVNRADLECSDVGEMRLVYGFVDANGAPLAATVIFEFRLPPQRNGVPYNATAWENDFHVLSTLPMGSAAYLATLENLINDITWQGRFPGQPNRDSAIGQVRTNEISFGSGPWKMREHRLKDLGGGPTAMRLVTTTTADTPHDSFNGSAALDAYLAANIGALATFTQSPVPAALLGGETSVPLPGPTPWWDHTVASPLTPIERHHFGFATCNGCHLSETGTTFLHVGGRNAGSPAPLSPFLSTSTATAGGGMPAASLSVPDPAGTGAVFRYNEPWRRVCEASRMLRGGFSCWSRANGAH
ncbi:MAG: hypothetical protein ACTHU0_22795 [Kofleriaceae bacterium]